MVPIFYQIVYKVRGWIAIQLLPHWRLRQLRDVVAKEVNDAEKEIDILNWVTRTALELVGQGGLGHSFDPLDRDWQNPYAEILKSLM